MIYVTVVKSQIIKALTNASQIYTFAFLLISITLQILDEDNTNSKGY